MIMIESAGHVATVPQRATDASGRDRVTWRVAVNGVKQRQSDGAWTGKGQGHRAVWLDCVYFPEQSRNDRVDPMLEALLLKLAPGDAIQIRGRVREISQRLDRSGNPEANLGVVVDDVVAPLTSSLVPDKAD